jgi:two-component system OmpR family sensor kinase
VSLRGRLVATLLALAAIGMLALGAVTYATQRDYLLERVDDQTRTAQRVMGGKLDGDGRGDLGGFPERPGGPKPPDVGLPSGTWGAQVAADGTVLGSAVVSSYGEVGTAPAGTVAPKLPGGLHEGQVLTVDAVDGGDRFRVRIDHGRFGGALVAVAVPLTDATQTLHRLLLVETLVIAGVLLLLGVLSWFLVRVELRPLERIGRTADAIAAGELSKRVEVASPRTEVGRLGLALNAMLGRLEGAFAERRASEDRLRRFLADASHELRTPLASIRGYAELFRIGAAREGEDVEKAMRRIEEESSRMGVLVEDLLTLARLDEVREKAAEPVDLASLADDAVADARAVDPDRAITATGEDDVIALGDPDQLRQVLANLVRNALVHTPPGTPVEVDARSAGEEVVLTVRDHGPGLPTADADELFGRFWRAEAGRERGRAGAGLGLAIVAGIVRAHGGRVHAENASDGGARFVVTLPAGLPARSPELTVT